MKTIPLSKGLFALVDDEDFERVNAHKWQITSGYATRTQTISAGKHRTVYMHREIMETPDGMETDHRDGNRLNNSRDNLRICSTSQNQANRQNLPTQSGQYRGVRYDERISKWTAKIQVNKKCMWLGSYDTAEMAAREYDKAAKLYFGDFARLNF